MRALWSGSLSFGLVNIPAKLYAATEPADLEFHFLHKQDLSPVRFAKMCKKENKEIRFHDIVRGFEYGKDRYVVLTDEDFKKADIRKTKSIEILDFSDEREIDSIYFERPYFLEPDKGAERAYALLREALKKAKRVGIARFVVRNREHIGVVRPYGNALLLNQLRYAAEVRSPSSLKLPSAKVAEPREINVALKLIDELTGTFRPNAYTDTYAKELLRVVEDKKKGKTPRAKGRAPAPTKVPDLLATLKASIEEKQRAGTRT